jgi:hypothetical protein
LAAQIQVWDAAQHGSMDPLLVITEGLGGALASRLSWDAAGRMLAAAAGGDVAVWDLAAAKERRVSASYALAGFGEGSRVACLAFQPGGTLLVRGLSSVGPVGGGDGGPTCAVGGGQAGPCWQLAASTGQGMLACAIGRSRADCARSLPSRPQAAASDDGLCFIFDTATFSSAGAAGQGPIAHVASGRLVDAGAAHAAPAEGAPAAAAAAAAAQDPPAAAPAALVKAAAAAEPSEGGEPAAAGGAAAEAQPETPADAEAPAAAGAADAGAAEAGGGGGEAPSASADAGGEAQPEKAGGGEAQPEGAQPEEASAAVAAGTAAPEPEAVAGAAAEAAEAVEGEAEAAVEAVEAAEEAVAEAEAAAGANGGADAADGADGPASTAAAGGAKASDPGVVAALAWHSSGSILLGTSTGARRPRAHAAGRVTPQNAATARGLAPPAPAPPTRRCAPLKTPAGMLGALQPVRVASAAEPAAAAGEASLPRQESVRVPWAVVGGCPA